MKALINYKICDNARECGGIEVCPTGAMYFDENKESIVVDEDKCTYCGICVKGCPIGAIRVARNEEEYKQIQEEIENDPRTIKDLFVDRYGAVPLSTFFNIKASDLDKKITTGKVVLVEVYCDDSIECLIKSVPIKEIISDIDQEVLFFKVKVNSKLKQKYKITTLPSLLVFNKGKFTGMVEGYYTLEQKEELRKKLKKLIIN